MIPLVVVLVFILVSSAGLTYFMIEVNRAGVLISGNVSEIEKCPRTSLVTLGLPDGQSFRFSSTNRKLDGIQVCEGDKRTGCIYQKERHENG
jgi:hypothetical protein